MKLLSHLIIIGAGLSLFACSHFAEQQGMSVPNFDELLQAQTEQKGRVCIRESDINGYGVLSDDVVSVSVRNGKPYYLVTTLYQCHSLLSSPAVVFSADFGEFCAGGRNKILSNDEECPVRSIYEFNSRDEAFAAFEQAEQTRELAREAKQQSKNKK